MTTPDQMARKTSTDQLPLELTILMPCLNEAETIEGCVSQARAYLGRMDIRGEVLVADNGSSDGSQALALNAGARVITVEEKGYGAALRGGIAAARGRYTIMGDADRSYDFSELDAFVSQLHAGRDLVVGNRFRGGIAKNAMPFLHRYLGNPVLSFVGRLFFKIGIGDFHCGLRGFNTGRIRDLALHTTGMEFASEMVIAAALRGYDLAEVPTKLSVDGRSRPPHLRSWQDGWRHLRFLLMFSPRWLFIYPGFALIGLGIFIAALLFDGSIEVAPGVHLDIHTFIVASISILIGLQGVCFGMLARRFATAYGFLPTSDRYGSFLESITLEKGLILAAILATLGMSGILWSFINWASVDFGPLNYPHLMRVLVLSLTAVAAGFQIALVAFLAAILDLPIKRDLLRSG